MLSRAQGVEVGGEDCPWHLSHAGQTLRTHWLRLVTGLGSSLLCWALGRVGAVCRAGGAVGLGGAWAHPVPVFILPFARGAGGALPDPATPCWTQGSRIGIVLCRLAPVTVMLRNEPSKLCSSRQTA